MALTKDSAGRAPALLNLVMLIFVLPQKDAIAAAQWASAGVVVAGLCQVALLWWGVAKSGSHVRWVWPTLNPEIRALIAKAVPGALSASAFQINIFISGILASQQAGARSWLNAADRLYQLPVGLVGVAIGVALLPRLSKAVHTHDHAGGQQAAGPRVRVMSVCGNFPCLGVRGPSAPKNQCALTAEFVLGESQ